MATKIIAVILALLLATAVFFAGFFTHKFTRSGDVSSYEWVLETIAKNYYGDFDRELASGLSLSALAGMLDKYSEYYTAEEYDAVVNNNSGKKSGAGFTANFIKGKGVYMITVEGNSPEYKAGLRPGMTVTGGKKDGIHTEFASADAAIDFLDSLDDGDEYVFVTDGDKELRLVREEYTASYTKMYTSDMSWYFEAEGTGGLSLKSRASDEMDFLPEKTAYVKLSQFYGTASEEFGWLMTNFNASECTSLILDLRNNGGGYVSVMQEISGYFTSSVTDETCTAMVAEYKNGKKAYADCVKQYGDSLVPRDTQVYVLANSGTASASEALIGVLISYGILDYENIYLSDYSADYLAWAGAGAKTRRSYGKGIMQSTFINPITREALKLTTARIYWQNGKCIHDVGLTTADGCRLAPAAWTATLSDEELRYVVNDITG